MNRRVVVAAALIAAFTLIFVPLFDISFMGVGRHSGCSSLFGFYMKNYVMYASWGVDRALFVGICGVYSPRLAFYRDGWDVVKFS